MPRSPAVFRCSPLGFALALLLTTMGTSLQSATAQTPTFDVERPTSSLEWALLAAETNSQLVTLATALMEARADTKISQANYKKGIYFFRKLHPEFYGNFFGNPYYATYDSEYVYMSRVRSLATNEIDSQSGLPGLFSCHPRWYDPAFGGQCEYRFAAFEFLLSPDGSLPTIASAPSIRDYKPIRLGANCHAEWCTLLYDEFLRHDLSEDYREHPVQSTPSIEKPGRADISTGSVDNVDKKEPPVPSEIETPGELIQIPDRRIDLPDDVHTSMLKTATSLRRTERTLQLENLVDQKYDGSDLSAQERARVVSQLSKVVAPKRSTGVLSHRQVGSQGRTPSGVKRGTMSRRTASNASQSDGQLKGVNLSAPKLPVPPPKHPDIELPDRASARFPALGQPGGPSGTGSIKVANPKRPGNSIRINATKIKPVANSSNVKQANPGGGKPSATPREPNLPEPSRSGSPKTSEDSDGN